MMDRAWFFRATPWVVLGAAIFAVGPIVLRDPLNRALWSLVSAIALLPVAVEREEGLCHKRYAIAGAPVLLGTLIFCGVLPATVVTAVAVSLIGGAGVLVALRVPVSLAIALTMFGACVSLTWPIWSAGLLATYDLGPWVQRIVNLSPPFALNTAISPTDPLTHRPLAYRLMNLGQDVSYTMPMSVWPCVALHAAIGAVGAIAQLWTPLSRNRGRGLG